MKRVSWAGFVGAVLLSVVGLVAAPADAAATTYKGPYDTKAQCQSKQKVYLDHGFHITKSCYYRTIDRSYWFEFQD